MLFRPQKIAVLEDGAVMAADDATVELFATTGGFGSLGELLAQNRTPTRTVDLDVLDAENATTTGTATSATTLSVSLNRGRPALDALAACSRSGSRIFSASRVRSCPSARSTTNAGCGTSGSTPRRAALLNDLYNRVDVDEARMGRLLCLFRLDFANPADMRPAIAGRPVYLAMAMDARASPEAQAAEPPSQPAARAAAMTDR